MNRCSAALAHLPLVEIGPATIHAITEAECVELVLAQLEAERGGSVLTLNLDRLRLLARDPSYAQLCRCATLVVADGMPLVWASRLQGTSLPERVAGSNLISSLTAAAAQRGRSIYLLGGAPGVADAAARILRQRHANLRIAGVLSPQLGVEDDARQQTEVIGAVCAARPDIVYVALGKRKEERLIERLRSGLPASWFVGVGISLSLLCGDVRRAPRWMQRAGLEWLHRLAQEPGRLGRRYLVEGVPFAIVLLLGAAARRWRRRRALRVF